MCNLKRKVSIKDIIIIGVFLILVVVNIISNIVLHGYSGVSSLIEQTILIVLSFIGLIEFADFCHWKIFVPDFYIDNREKAHEKEIETCISSFFDNDSKFVNDYDEESKRLFLSQVGITTEQLDRIRMDLIKMRCLPLQTLENAKKKVELFLKNGYPLIIDQNKIDAAKLAYNKVRYFINFTDAMFLPEYAREISSLLTFLIMEEEPDLKSVTRLVIPFDSNFLLGVEVSKHLGKPIVKMRTKTGKVEREKPWEGQLNATDKVIIIHDVLVSADQIIDAVDKLSSKCKCKILGVYCLVTRKEWKGAIRLEERGIRVHQIICLDDDDIRNIRADS